ncbi:MAG: hypothetical protein KDC87_17155, partial [Planctomycetes bacterium]|nr:hypothetical protein [Planctomycetota bacterium]
DIRELRVQLSVTNKAALASAKSVQNMGAVLSNRLAEQAAESSRKRERGIKPSALVMTSGTLLMSWALMFYLKTGSVNLALLGLVLVNIAGCAAVLLSRSED